jgi:very-short-patch-repair endonuclease
MSSIQSSVQELKEINTEIKRLTKTASELRKRATYIEKNIISFLNEKELPGVKDNRTAVIIENKKKTVTRNKKNIEQQTLKILEENGIQNPKQILEEITKVRKGEQVELQKVKMQEIRQR